MFFNPIVNYFFLFAYFWGFFKRKRNMNNIMYKNAFKNTNGVYIKSYYNHVLAKIIIFVMSSILKHLCIKNWMFNFVTLLKYKRQMTGNKLCKPAQRSEAGLRIICYPSSDIYT